MNVVPGSGACPPPVSGSLRGCELVRSRRLPPFPQPGRSTRLRHALNQGPPLPGSLAMGFLLSGRRWHRPQDQVGVAFVTSGLSSEQSNYLTAGGLDFGIGDGALTYGRECIVETYYNWEMKKGINLTLDFQE